MCRCGVQGHGLVVDLAVLSLWLNLMILKVFPKKLRIINGSMILWLSIAYPDNF